MQRRLKIAFHVEDLAKPSGERIIISPMQVTVEFDGSNLERQSQASEELQAAGLIIGRFILLTLSGKVPPTDSADLNREWVAETSRDVPGTKGDEPGG